MDIFMEIFSVSIVVLSVIYLIIFARFIGPKLIGTDPDQFSRQVIFYSDKIKKRIKMETIFLVIVPETTAFELGCSVEELKNMTEEAVKELVARNKNLKRADLGYRKKLNQDRLWIEKN